MLQLTDFRKAYGSHTVLHIPQLETDKGIYWIKGANGSGKSTLLKAIGGIIDFSGKITVDGISLSHEPVRYRQQINFAEAEPVFPEFLTGNEMIALFMQAKQAPPDQHLDYISSMQMQLYVDQPLGSYSSGMLKKLSLVLAFMGKPSLILLDEPLITLDAASLEVLYNWIRERQRQQGTSFLLSSHQQIDQQALQITGIIQIADSSAKYL